ncbi:MAG: M24 family metallopeptidase [Chlorobi bacterium]|nr:M24 family metallopeptidase [Chlorobiota bacterium]
MIITPRHRETFVIVGLRDFGAMHVRLLRRGMARGLVAPADILVIEPDTSRSFPKGETPPDTRIIHRDVLQVLVERWLPFLESGAPPDLFVPDPLAPHLLFELFEHFLGHAFAGQPVHCVRLQFDEPPETPYSVRLPSGMQALSFATWTCPRTCIEPRLCPATSSPKTWDMSDALRNHADEQNLYPVLFYPKELRHGVFSIPASEVLETIRCAIKHLEERGTAEYLVATVSACHGLAGKISARLES